MTNGDCMVNGAALRTEVETVLVQMGVPSGSLRPVPELLNHTHTRHRGRVVENDGHRGTGIPINLSRTLGVVKARLPVFRKHGYCHGQIAAVIETVTVKNNRGADFRESKR